MKLKETGSISKKEEAEETLVPRKFTGTFYFTNPDTEDFTAYWNKTAYTFKAGTRSPIVMYDEPLLNIQEIRKKWAFQLAERMWHKSAKFRALVKKSEGRAVPYNYSNNELNPYIQMCLEDAPLEELKVEKVPEKQTVKTRDPKTGRETTVAFDSEPNLVSMAEHSGNGPAL